MDVFERVGNRAVAVIFSLFGGTFLLVALGVEGLQSTANPFVWLGILVIGANLIAKNLDTLITIEAVASIGTWVFASLMFVQVYWDSIRHDSPNLLPTLYFSTIVLVLAGLLILAARTLDSSSRPGRRSNAKPERV